MSYTDLLVDRQDTVLKLTLNREARRNALNEEVMDALRVALEENMHDRTIRAIVLTGAGDKAFCAGGDLKPSSDTFGFDPSEPRTPFARLLRVARACDAPIVARVNGHCLAGGMGLLAMCDMAVASDKALFGLPEVKIGLFPVQVAALLERLIPPRKFAEMAITGEPVTAQEAQEMGLINYAVPAEELDAKTDWLVGRIIDKSPTAIRRGKYALRATRDMSVEESLTFMEAQLGVFGMTQDAKEGLAAFNEKRKPDWPGK